MSQHIMADIFPKPVVQIKPLQTCLYQHMYSFLYAVVVTQHLILNADAVRLNNDCPSLFRFYCISLFLWAACFVSFSFISV